MRWISEMYEYITLASERKSRVLCVGLGTVWIHEESHPLHELRSKLFFGPNLFIWAGVHLQNYYIVDYREKIYLKKRL